MKKLLIASLLIPTLAFAFSNRPDKCPSVVALQAVPLNLIETTDQANMFRIGVAHNQYDTTNDWSFIMNDVFGTSKIDAWQRANIALQTLSFVSGPSVQMDGAAWSCSYHNDSGVVATASTSSA